MNNKKTRELRTIELMLADYCRNVHQSDQSLCPQCSELLSYSSERIRKCKLGNRKTTCARCPIHCFKPEHRLEIRKVMRYAGPRMIFRHPVLALYHLLDSRLKQSRT